MSAVLESTLAKSGVATPNVELRRLPSDLKQAAERLELARQAISDTLSMPRRLKENWQVLIRSPVEELHQRRESVRAMFDEWLEAAGLTADILPDAARLAGRPLVGADQVPAAREEMSRFAQTILTRWKSQDDLAQLVLDTIELPDWFLNGPNPPGVGIPQHWIDATDDDPFAPLPEAQ